MDLLDKKTSEELARSILAEAAKAKNEIQCAQRDIKKAESRLSFLVLVANQLIDRQGD